MAQDSPSNTHQEIYTNDLGNAEETNQGTKLENREPEASQLDDYRTKY